MLSKTQIFLSNWRLKVAITSVRTFGRNTDTMTEIYSAWWARHNRRAEFHKGWREFEERITAFHQAEAIAKAMFK